MPSDKDALKRDLEHLMLSMQQMRAVRADPTIVAEAHGLIVTDIEGNQYMDGLSGIWVANIGYGNEAVIAAMVDQLHKFTFSMPVGTVNEPTIRLAKLLADITPPELTTAFLVNSGSEATETAVKLARQYHLQTGHPRKTKVISRYLSWHGATLGALAMSGATGLKTPFEPYPGQFLHVAPPYCYRCPFGLTYPACALACAQVIERIIEWEGPETVAAIIVEPVMVAPGVVVPPPDYLPLLRDICTRQNVLLIFDEVITGFGRTGKMFAMETFGVVPDAVALAKGMSSGYAPLAGVVMSQKMADAFLGDVAEHKEFAHGHTFGANPLSAAAGLANIREILDRHLVDNAARVGAHLQRRGRALLAGQRMVGDVRGIGLMFGVEFVADRATKAPFAPGVEPGLKVQAAGKRRGLFMRASPNWVALAPPLIATEADVDRMLDILAASVDEVQAEILPE